MIVCARVHHCFGASVVFTQRSKTIKSHTQNFSTEQNKNVVLPGSRVPRPPFFVCRVLTSSVSTKFADFYYYLLLHHFTLYHHILSAMSRGHDMTLRDSTPFYSREFTQGLPNHVRFFSCTAPDTQRKSQSRARGVFGGKHTRYAKKDSAA